MPRTYYVYVLASRSRTLYVGVTSNIVRRVEQHRSSEAPRFAGRYRAHRLVYVESTSNSRDAIGREKQIKSWTRAKKLALVATTNPTWKDLAAGWFE
jgi:putative endonuclease